MSSRRLPPLGALRAFEAAARLRSFKRAAQELSVTPTAISHQIRSLEEHIGVRLFERQTRRVVPTAAAERLFPVLRDGFDAFAVAVEALRAQPQRRALTLSATLSFTAKWLVPRMASFRQACPDLDLRLHASDDPVDLHAGLADAAIRYGRGPWPGLDAEPLVENRFAPVCSPHLGLRGPHELRRHALLHSEWRHPSADTPTWQRWRERANADGLGLDDLDLDAGLRFTDESHAIQAAIAGHGVALLSLALVADDLAAGALVQPFGPVLDGHPHWWVQAPGAQRADLAALRAWLRAQAGAG
ncbi:LysR family transcriptional regulator, glycine cleavage system transcriptional activator [Lysobacter sp. yr284]|uniref:LysR substrate-binding domain-containing protein n=1 Tax=Lysobacter sp. yr284 TaxID=1761791 RepID=UPI00089A25BA|nr:LysR substrate-binding domain-containing protein [Lysobacter sp. yr284]SDZ13136.1 LysR family transcriptional regulator, glycine cleavage system transcriptional activator [Lysobacter sp. yr284]